MSVQKGLFKRTAQIHFVADSAKGMNQGMAVKLNGFKIGTLAKLVMGEDGRVSAVLSVADEYVHLIHKDARAKLTKEELIGEGIIEVVSGSDSQPTLENNAVIVFERSRDVGEELSQLAVQLQPILADVKKITAYVDNPDGDIKKSLQELKRATTALADTGEGVSDITRRNKKQIQTAINSASNTLVNLDAALPPLVKRVDASLQQVEGASTDAHAITSRLVTDLPPVVREGRETLVDTHEMLGAVKSSWPINKLLPAQEEHSLPLDSHVPIKR
jgi:phospholipid/cholesterol/gamma-HCH transport system substrate-binding protein